MTIAYIAEFDRMPEQGANGVPMFQTPPLTQQKVTFTTTSTASAAFHAKTRYIRVKIVGNASQAEFVKPDQTPTATTANSAIHMEAAQWEGFGVPGGGKVAFIEAA